jgi:hypothetical protein
MSLYFEYQQLGYVCGMRLHFSCDEFHSSKNPMTLFEKVHESQLRDGVFPSQIGAGVACVFIYFKVKR